MMCIEWDKRPEFGRPVSTPPQWHSYFRFKKWFSWIGSYCGLMDGAKIASEREYNAWPMHETMRDLDEILHNIDFSMYQNQADFFPNSLEVRRLIAQNCLGDNRFLYTNSGVKFPYMFTSLMDMLHVERICKENKQYWYFLTAKPESNFPSLCDIAPLSYSFLKSTVKSQPEMECGKPVKTMESESNSSNEVAVARTGLEESPETTVSIVPQTIPTIQVITVDVSVQVQSMDTLNQKLVDRKNQKIKKLSKKRRRRTSRKYCRKISAHVNSNLNVSAKSHNAKAGKSFHSTGSRAQCKSSDRIRGLPKVDCTVKQLSDGESSDFTIEFQCDPMESEQCASPVISFIMGLGVDDSESDGDFEGLNTSSDSDCDPMEGEQCASPTISFVIGHEVDDSESESDGDFEGLNTSSDSDCDPMEGDQCASPTISFVIGNEVDDSGSESDGDFDDLNTSDSEFQFMDSIMTGITTLHIGPQPKVNDTECTVSFIEISEMSPELQEVNRRWSEMMSDVTANKSHPPKVSFCGDDELAVVFPVDVYDRKGEWEIYATERMRFRRRIQQVEKILLPVLSAVHREKVLHRLGSELSS